MTLVVPALPAAASGSADSTLAAGWVGALVGCGVLVGRGTRVAVGVAVGTVVAVAVGAAV